MAAMTEGYQILTSSAQGDTHSGQLYITRIRYVDGTTAGHKCEVSTNDSSPLLLASLRCTAANSVDEVDFHPYLTVGSLNITDLDSGSVHVYFK